MNPVKISMFPLAVIACFATTAVAETIQVNFDTPNYMRYFKETELEFDDGMFFGEFTDTFLFPLKEGGKLTFTLTEKDSRLIYGEHINIEQARFLEGVAPTTPWEKESPYSGSDLISTFTWDYLAPGEYHLEVKGNLYGGTPITFYQMTDVSFTAGAAPNPVPEPAPLALVGLGLAGIGGCTRKFRSQKSENRNQRK